MKILIMWIVVLLLFTHCSQINNEPIVDPDDTEIRGSLEKLRDSVGYRLTISVTSKNIVHPLEKKFTLVFKKEKLSVYSKGFISNTNIMTFYEEIPSSDECYLYHEYSINGRIKSIDTKILLP